MIVDTLKNFEYMDFTIYGSFFILSPLAVILKQMDPQKDSVFDVSFRRFQKKFFFVYFLALLGDGLQGPYVYELYDYYGYKESEIAILYVTGFGSSVLFGTATGSLADKIGRKKVTLLFCIIYFLCCVVKLSPNFYALMLGRVFGGIATSILFSTFESWYVYEHVEHYNFPSEWIGVTFSTATIWNGILAIFAGVISNFFADGLGFGPASPFVAACVPFIICGLLVLKTWDENYGNQQLQLVESCMEGFTQIIRDRKILILGGIQSMIESCMYIFVFLWTPVLKPSQPPLGMVFACFMIAMMIGSSLFSFLSSRGYKSQHILRIVLIILAFTNGVCVLTCGPNPSPTNLLISYGAFICLEVAIGMYFPAMSYCKSLTIPESHRANVMNWFRVPMNLITCATLLGFHIDWIAKDKRIFFLFCAALAAFGIVLSTRFIQIFQQDTPEKSKEEHRALLNDFDA